MITDNHNKNDQLNELIGLTEGERLNARDRAVKNIQRAIGSEPTPDQFTRAQFSAYPTSYRRAIIALLLIVGFTAFLVSAFRLFAIGRAHFLESIPDDTQAIIVGIAVVLMSEFLVVVSGLARPLIDSGKWKMFFPMFLGVTIALVGNWTMTNPNTVFGWLETLAPPIVVFIVALIGEQLLIKSLKERHEAQLEYTEALNAWKTAHNNPEKSERWLSTYANALKATLIEVNSKGTGKTRRIEIMNGLNGRDWSNLVRNELNADNWYIDQPADKPQLTPTSSNGTKSAIYDTVQNPVNPTKPVIAMAATPTSSNGHNGHNQSH